MEKGKKAIVRGVILFLISVVVISGMWLDFMNKDGYTINTAENWLWRARATNDLEDMAKYMKQALFVLDRFEGNPSWFYPTPDSDWTLIKQNIKENIKSAESLSHQDPNSFAVQQMVHNLQETIIEIVDHLKGAGWWQYNAPWRLAIEAFFGYLWWWVIPIIIYFFKED